MPQSFGMKSEVIHVATGRRESVHDITSACAEFTATAAGGGDGLLHVFVPHATAGLALMELGAGSDADLLDQTVYAQAGLSLAVAYEQTSRVMVENMLAADAKEGIGAFFEKRAPKWPGA